MSDTVVGPYRTILRTGVPMVLSSAAAMAAQVVVIGLIGRIGHDALYVRSVYSPIAFLFLAMTTGLAVTLQVAVARSSGRGESSAVAGLLGSVARAGTGVYVLLGIALTALAGPLAHAVRTEAAERAEFQRFLAAMAIATLLGMLGELCSATLRGLGRAGTAACITAVYLAVNLGLIALGGLVLHMGLMVVPAAGIAAAVLELALGALALARGGTFAAGRIARWRPEVPVLLRAIGIPVGASYLVLFVTNLLLLRIVAQGGPDVVAGFNVGYTLQTAVIVPGVGLGSAVAVLMNQRLGANDPAAAHALYRRGLHLALAGYGLVTVVLTAVAGPLASAMAGGPRVAGAAEDFLRIVGPSFGCTGVVLVTLTVLEQVGRGRLAIALNVAYFAVIVALGQVLVDGPADLTRLYWTMCLAALLALGAGVPLVGRAVARPRVVHPAPASEVAA